MEGLLALAEDLQLKGLAQSRNKTHSASEDIPVKIEKVEIIKNLPNKSRTEPVITEYSRPELNESMPENYSLVETVTAGDVSVDANKEELKDQMNSMMEKSYSWGKEMEMHYLWKNNPWKFNTNEETY